MGTVALVVFFLFCEEYLYALSRSWFYLEVKVKSRGIIIFQVYKEDY